MGEKCLIPYGVINWATLGNECHFVDNTAYIRKLEDVRTPVFLRPKAAATSSRSRRCDVAHGVSEGLVRRSRPPG